MGMGSTKQVGTAELLRPEQQQFLQGLLNQAGPLGIQSLVQMLQPGSQGQENLFNQSVLEPTLQQYRQRILPEITQAYGAEGLGSSSALNQALAASAQDLGTMLGQQRMAFREAELGRQLNALNLLGGLSTQRTFEPIYQQSPGLGGTLLGLAGQLGGAYIGGLPARRQSRAYEDLISKYANRGIE